MSKRIIVVPGSVFNKLIVNKTVSGAGHDMCHCSCECGNKTIVRKSDLVRGHTASCGCLNKKRGKPRDGVFWNKDDKKYHVRFAGRIIARFFEEQLAQVYYQRRRKI